MTRIHWLRNKRARVFEDDIIERVAVRLTAQAAIDRHDGFTISNRHDLWNMLEEAELQLDLDGEGSVSRKGRQRIGSEIYAITLSVSHEGTAERDRMEELQHATLRESLTEAAHLVQRYRAWHDELDYWEHVIDQGDLSSTGELDNLLDIIQLGPMSDPANWPAHPNE
jgi:hypothetical protein